MSALPEVNSYGRQLDAADIAQGRHREFVGGLWEEIGALQFDFLKANGLQPQHRLVDIGCGALRGGVHFAGWLDAGNYHGLDINASLIAAGRIELERSGLSDKPVSLIIDDSFDVRRFDVPFDYALAVSVFTHLPINMIVRCLQRVAEVLAPTGVFYATYFEAPQPAWLESIQHEPGGVITYYDSDPYHYAFAEFQWMAAQTGLRVESIGEWAHPRNQHMLAFRLP